MQVVKAPDNKLRAKARPVKKVTPQLLQLAKQMIKLAKSFKDPEGVGLASTQIGRDEQMFVGKLDKENFEVIFNPKILFTGKRTKTFFEGCLSIKDHYGEVKRPTTATVSFMNSEGQTVKKRLSGLAAWIFQHEVDHLSGILFVDRVLEQKGRMFKVIGKDKTGADIFEEVGL